MCSQLRAESHTKGWVMISHHPPLRSRFYERVSMCFSEGSAGEGRTTRVHCCNVEVLFDAQELVVLRHALGASGSTGLDLAGVGGNREVRMVVSSVSPER